TPQFGLRQRRGVQNGSSRMRTAQASNASPRLESSSNANAPSIVASTSNSSTTSGSFPITSRAGLRSSCWAASGDSHRRTAPQRSVASSDIHALKRSPRDLGELLNGLVSQVAPQLLDRRHRVGEVPENDPEEHSRLVEESLVIRQLVEQLLDLPQDVGLLVAEVVEVRVQCAADQLELVVRQLDRVIGHQYGPLGS